MLTLFLHEENLWSHPFQQNAGSTFRPSPTLFLRKRLPLFPSSKNITARQLTLRPLQFLHNLSLSLTPRTLTETAQMRYQNWYVLRQLFTCFERLLRVLTLIKGTFCSFLVNRWFHCRSSRPHARPFAIRVSPNGSSIMKDSRSVSPLVHPYLPPQIVETIFKISLVFLKSLTYTE